MSQEQPDNPLHGVTLQAIVEDLVERHGFEALAARIDIRCFTHDPSIKSSLKFLRKTPWARAQVERLYLEDQQVVARNRKRNQRRAAMRAHREAEEAAADRAPEVDRAERTLLRRFAQPMSALIRDALDENDAMEAYLARPPYQRNDYLGWIQRARLEGTREKRLLQMLAELRAGDRYMAMPWGPGPPPR